MQRYSYLRALDVALHGAGLPYGYAVTVWSTGGMLTGAHDVPSIPKVFAFAAGAAAGYGILRFLTQAVEGEAGAQFTRSPRLVRAGAIHVSAIGLAVGSAALIAQINSPVVWFLGPFSATLLYLAVSSAEKALLAAEGEG